MKVTVVGAGNSGLAMAAHLSKEGNKVTLWNRSKKTVSKLIDSHVIYCDGVVQGTVKIDLVTCNIKAALENPEIILITTPANSHKELAKLIAKNIKKEALIVLNPGRTFGALEFEKIYKEYNQEYNQIIAETQTIIYTCRKTGEDSVNIIAFKDDVLISTVDASLNEMVLSMLPECIRKHFIAAESMIQTSIGNVGMILHCTPLLLNTGWTESKNNMYKYYYDGITPTVGKLIEMIDKERVTVSEKLGLIVETTKDWLIRTYHVQGNDIYECIQNNEDYKMIDAPKSLKHRYIFEDVPCGLVPLESIGKKLGIKMNNTSLIIDLASRLLNYDFRENGRNLEDLFGQKNHIDLDCLFESRLR